MTTPTQAVDVPRPAPTTESGGSTPAVAGPSAAGVILQAEDTGRVLMLQRTLGDTHGGLWEFPGGNLDPGEDPWTGAQREFAQEVGHGFPGDAKQGQTWTSPDGVYEAFVATIPLEHPFPNLGDGMETSAWWALADIKGAHIRPEVLTMPLDEILSTPTDQADQAMAAAATAPVDNSTVPSTPSADPAELQKIADSLGTFLSNNPDSELAPEMSQLLDELASCLSGEDTNNPTAMDTMTASAATALLQPPDEWFEPFPLDGPTPFTVTASGQVFGHLATWDECHTGYSACLRPPSDPKAPYFQLGQVVTASGATRDVGVVTVGGGHWTKDGFVASLEHMDDAHSVGATVVVKEDEYGIGLFGAVAPDATPNMVAALRRSPLSGGWSKRKGVRRLVAAHAVNTPGFVIPRTLVASAQGDDFFIYGRVPDRQPDLRPLARRIAQSAGLDQTALVASARAAMVDLSESVVASVVGDENLPIADYGTGWDGGAAAARVFDHFTDASGKVDTAGVSKAFLWRDESHPADQKSGYGLPFADIINGELQIVPRGVQAVAGGHGVGQLQADNAAKAEIQAKVSTIYAHVQNKFPEAPDSPFKKGA